MKVGDLVQFRSEAMSLYAVQKRRIVLKTGHHKWTHDGNKLLPSVRCLWDHPAAGIRWAQVRWLEVISEGPQSGEVGRVSENKPSFERADSAEGS